MWRKGAVSSGACSGGVTNVSSKPPSRPIHSTARSGVSPRRRASRGVPAAACGVVLAMDRSRGGTGTGRGLDSAARRRGLGFDADETEVLTAEQQVVELIAQPVDAVGQGALFGGQRRQVDLRQAVRGRERAQGA